MEVITVGRSSDNDIVINDATVSRTHLQIVQKDGEGCFVVDLNSANGTYVNGQKICGEVRLRPNDTIRIGNTTLPWPEYIKASTGKQKVVPSSTKNNRLWLWVAICAVAVTMLIGGIGLFVYHSHEETTKNPENKKQQQNEIEGILYQELDKVESKRKQENYNNEVYRQKVNEKLDKERTLTDEANKKTDEANKRAEKANKDKENAENAVKKYADSAKAAKASAKAAKASEEAAKASAKAAKASEEAANKRASKAEKDAQYRSEILQSFYEEYSQMDDKQAEKVCEQLNQKYEKKRKIFKRVSNAKDKIKGLFNNSDDENRIKIINAIRSVKGEGPLKIDKPK